MHQITCGETPKKIKILNGNIVKSYLDSEKNKINVFKDKSCLYSNKFLIEDLILNYLNDLPANNVQKTLKNIILKEYYSLEKAYPYLGDYFISRLFDLEKPFKKKKTFLFSYKDQNKFLKSIKEQNAKNLGKWIFENVSLERSISIETYKGNNICIDCSDNFDMNLEYDFEFFRNSNGLIVENYKVVIIDGYIDSIGEIHHVMHDSNSNKTPYVIFCHGMNDDVKFNIIKNNSEARTQVLPVSINFNENTLNILNDIAVIHRDAVINNKMGKTISQALKSDLNSGKSIQFFKNKLVIKPVAEENEINQHRIFLKNRIEEAKVKNNVNYDVLINRLKNFSSKSLKVYLPEDIKERKFIRELDYVFRFMSSLSKSMVILDVSFKENYFIPTYLVFTAEKRLESIKNIIDNIEKVVIEVDKW